MIADRLGLLLGGFAIGTAIERGSTALALAGGLAAGYGLWFAAYEWWWTWH